MSDTNLFTVQSGPSSEGSFDTITKEQETLFLREILVKNKTWK